MKWRCGGVLSPLLANVYLHHVLDEWCEQDVKPRLRGRVFEAWKESWADGHC